MTNSTRLLYGLIATMVARHVIVLTWLLYYRSQWPAPWWEPLAVAFVAGLAAFGGTVAMKPGTTQRVCVGIAGIIVGTSYYAFKAQPLIKALGLKFYQESVFRVAIQWLATMAIVYVYMAWQERRETAPTAGELTTK